MSKVDCNTSLEQTIAYCRAMLVLQDKINQRIHPQWRQQFYPWYRAIWVECAELLDHYGWKWWKKQTPDMSQIHLELVDIWHFGLSDALQQSEHLDDNAERLGTALYQAVQQSSQNQQTACSDKNFIECVEAFITSTLNQAQFDEALFCDLIKLSGLSIQSLYENYIGKNVLNRFRQDHGYQTGGYIKCWQDREDNEHLAELLSHLPIETEDAANELYQQLTRRYINLVLEPLHECD